MTAKKSPGGRRASEMYATMGPNPAQATRHGLDADTVKAEYQAWRDEYLERWEAGEQVPEPPYASVLDSYARAQHEL